MAGYSNSGGGAPDTDMGQETTLGSAYSPVDYMSITSFPRLPEEDTQPGENTQKSRKDEDNFLSEQETGNLHMCRRYLKTTCLCYDGFHSCVYYRGSFNLCNAQDTRPNYFCFLNDLMQVYISLLYACVLSVYAR